MDYEIREIKDFNELERQVNEEKKAVDKRTDYKPFFVTFGCDKAFGKNYVGIIAPSEEDARNAMHECFGDKWGFMYSGAAELKDQVTRFGLTPLCCLKVRKYGWESNQAEVFRIADIEYMQFLQGLPA